MKVLQINSVCGIRSTGRICTDIATILDEQGHPCKVAYGNLTVPNKYKKYAHVMANYVSIRIDVLKTRMLDNAGFNSALQTKRFIRWMKEYDPDIIHLHNIHGYYVNVAVLFRALKEMDKPVIWTLHDCWPFTGHCAHFMSVGCNKWKTGCENCPQTGVYPASLFRDRSRKNYMAKKASFTGVKDLTIVTPSQWLADLAKQSFLKEYEIRVIPNGIDLDAFKPTDGTFRETHSLQNKKIVLGVASAWGKSKGLFDMYKLADMLDESYQVVLVGLSPAQMESVPKNVIGITRTDNIQQLAHLYTTADIFVNPTYQDTYPTVNLESQACGTPAITYRTGGSPESVPPRQVVKQGDLDALFRAVTDFRNCTILEADFSAKSCFEKYVSLYLEKDAATKILP